jgi:hypothetical protein
MSHQPVGREIRQPRNELRELRGSDGLVRQPSALSGGWALPTAARHACRSHDLRIPPGKAVLLLNGPGPRRAGIDPPKIHDVGDLVLQFADRFEGVSGRELAALAEASKELRKEREFSFYGDIDFIPTDEYDADDADTALGQARLAAACLGRLLGV